MVTPVLKNKPEGPDILSDSQVDIQNNFNYLKTALDRDHKIEYDQATTADNQQGLHRKLSLMPAGMANPPLTAGSQTMVFSSSSDLFVQNNSNFPARVQLTNNTMGAPSNSTNGYTWLAGGMIMQWGTTAALPSLGTLTVSFPVAFSSVPHSVVLTPVTTSTNLNHVNNAHIRINSNPALPPQVTSTQFTILNNSSDMVKCYWIAIGPKA